MLCNSHSRHRPGTAHEGLPGADVDMLNFGGKKVYLACGKTDMRKSINGLVAIVEGSFKLNPFDEALYVFCNRNRDRVKILEWDGDGFWLYFKRLEKGHFRWPTALDEPTMTLDHLEEKVVSSKERRKLKQELHEIEMRTEILYENKVSGVISAERFSELAAASEIRRNEIQNLLTDIDEAEKEAEHKLADIGRCLDTLSPTASTEITG